MRSNNGSIVLSKAQSHSAKAFQSSQQGPLAGYAVPCPTTSDPYQSCLSSAQLLIQQLERLRREGAAVADPSVRAGTQGARHLAVGADAGDAGMGRGVAVGIAG